MKENKISWLNVAYGLSAIVLIGMSLPWAEGWDLGVMRINRATYRGWNLVWLVIPALVAVVSSVAAFRNKEQKKWLWAALISSIVSLIVMIGFGISLIASTKSMMINKIPLYGFWITLAGFLGAAGIVAGNLFENKLLPK